MLAWMGGSRKRLRQVSKRPNAVSAIKPRAEPLQEYAAPTSSKNSDVHFSQANKHAGQELFNNEFKRLANDAALASARKKQRLQPQSVLMTSPPTAGEAAALHPSNTALNRASFPIDLIQCAGLYRF